MGSSCTLQDLSIDDRSKAIEELIRGREFANKLKAMLIEGGGLSSPSSTAGDRDLVMKILGSFTETLEILNRCSSDEVTQIPANNRRPSCEGRNSEDSGESIKNSTFKDRRGCYKRRKKSQTWTKITPTLIDDGHAWRKYGQKVILHATYPRSYYRCTHKYDQDCQATKQVQRTDDKPCMYQITYIGHHTCKNPLRSSQIVLDPIPGESSVLLSFGTESNLIQPNTKPITNIGDHHHPFFGPFNSNLKQEMPSLNHSHTSSSDYLVSTPFDHQSCGGPISTVMSSGGSDYGDVVSSSGGYSCTASTDHHKLDMDVMAGSVNLEDVLQYYEFC